MKLADIHPGETCYVKYSPMAWRIGEYSREREYSETHKGALIDRVFEDQNPQQCTVLEVRLPFGKRNDGVLIELAVRPCTEHDIWECQRLVGETIRVVVSARELASEDTVIGWQADALAQEAWSITYDEAIHLEMARRKSGDPEILRALLREREEDAEHEAKEITRIKARIELFRQLHDIAAPQLMEIDRTNGKYVRRQRDRCGYRDELIALIRSHERLLKFAQYRLARANECLGEAREKYDAAVILSYEHEL